MGRPNGHEPDSASQPEDAAGLRRELETLQAVIDSSEQPVFAVDRDLRYTVFNQAHADVMRALYGAEISLGGRLPDYQSVAADRDVALANLGRALTGERVTASSFSGEEGQRRYFDVVHTPQTDAAGDVVGVLVRAFEVTERRRAEATLGENRALLQGVIEGISDAIYAKDIKGRYLLFNGAAERVTGKSAADVLGKDDRVLFPEDEATVVMAGDRAVMESGAVTTYEETLTDAQGKRVTFLSTKGPIRDEHGKLLGLFGIGRDLTDRIASSAALRESEAQLRVILDATADGILAVDTSGRILKTNHRFAELWRVPDALLEQGDDAALLAFVRDQLADPDEFLRRVESLYASDETVVDALVFKDGRVFERHSAVTRQESVVTGRVWSFSDVSEQVHARTQLQERERALDTLMGNLPGMAYRCLNDPQWTTQFVSAGCEALTGYPPQALLGNATVAYGDLVLPEDAPRLWRETQTAIGAGEPWTYVYRIVTAAGLRRWVWERGVAVTDAAGEQALEGFIQDVTDQHESEARLEAAAAEWRRTFDAMRDSVAVFDGEGRLLRCNLATTKLTGRGFADVIGRPCYEVFHGAHQFHESCPQLLARGSGQPETSLIEQDGRWLRVTFEPQVDDAGRVQGGVHVVSDVSELMEAERELRESEARFEGFADHFPGDLFMHDEERRHTYVNRREQMDRDLPRDAWLGKTPSQVWDCEDATRAEAEVQRALDGEVVDLIEPWRPTGANGYLHSIYFPIPREGKPPLVGGLSIDVTEQVEAQEEVARQAERLQRIIEGAVLAMSHIVEARDPYTAGHERRVSELAAAIALTLGLDEESVRGVRIAGILHDVGKIIVPAEILNKPGRLTPTEFELIKGHAQAAYEILKPIDFEVAIAEIVLQHHERLDGSGYPQGLSGGDIRPEAGILAVADVVEAMSSHRPYRAALGIESALAEIREHAGVKYDAEVAAACVRLVEEQGFEFTP